jgi:hypothetical protein
MNSEKIDTTIITKEAPVSEESPVTPGGIDFNSNQLQLDVQKQGAGVGINFDPELIKKFENGNFQGFMPIIINISPITNISAMLGLKPEDSLAKA